MYNFRKMREKIQRENDFSVGGAKAKKIKIINV